jgi:hypothetical protein
MRRLVLFLAVLLGACAAPEPQILGRYASRLSSADIEEIKVVAANHLARLHMHATGPPRKLEAVRRDYVHVDAPILDRYADTASFDVMKRHGRWIIDGHGGGVRGLAPGENVVVY